MRQGGGRAKGSAFERQVAKDVIQAFAKYGITVKDAYRTPLSGGHFAASRTDPGDLVISPKLAEYFPFSVECKSCAKLDWALLFNCPPTSHWTKWMAQCMKAAGSKPALVVFKGNRTPIFAMYAYKSMADFFPDISISHLQYIKTKVCRTSVRIVLFSDLLTLLVEASDCGCS